MNRVIVGGHEKRKWVIGKKSQVYDKIVILVKLD